MELLQQPDAPLSDLGGGLHLPVADIALPALPEFHHEAVGLEVGQSALPLAAILGDSDEGGDPARPSDASSDDDDRLGSMMPGLDDHQVSQEAALPPDPGGGSRS